MGVSEGECLLEIGIVIAIGYTVKRSMRGLLGRRIVEGGGERSVCARCCWMILGYNII